MGSIDDLRSDIQKLLKTAAREVANIAADELTECAKSAITQFYQESQQITSGRYMNTNNLLNNSYQKYKHDNGSGAYGGVKITTSAMGDYPSWYPKGHTFSGEIVGNWAWNDGQHGGGNYAVQGSIIPIEIVKEKYYDETWRQSVFERGKAKAQSQSFKVLRF